MFLSKLVLVHPLSSRLFQLDFLISLYFLNIFKGSFAPRKTKVLEESLSFSGLLDYANKVISLNADANGPRDLTLDASPSLSAWFKVFGRNVSIEYMNKIDFVITEEGFSRSSYSISS